MVLDIVDDGRIVQKRLDPNSKSQLWRVVDINSEHGADETDKQLAQYKEDLKAELTRQFDERQKAMADELKQLRQRLEKLEKQINDRQNSRQSFIERSLNDALSSIQQATANIDQTPHPLIITIPNGETRIINGSVMIDPASGAAEPIFAESPEHDHGDGAVGRPQLPPKY
jgi:flagellar biosynthesis GTPase FlhF